MEAVSQDSGSQKSKQLTLSVQKALKLLSAFSSEKSEFSLVELAQVTGLSVSTAHRLLATLEAESFIERVPNSGHYRLSIKMFELGSTVLHGMDLNIVGTPIMARLATETEDTTYLSVWSSDAVLCIARIEGVRHLRSEFLAVGRHLPLHAGAASKVLLAHLPDDQIRRVLSHCSFTAYTDRTITDMSGLFNALSQVREQGYAVSDEEITKGITALAAPIFDHTGKAIAAISLSGATGRYGLDNRPFLVGRVKESAYQISIRLGHLPKLTL